MDNDTRIFAKPAADRVVPLPDGKPWPEQGEWVDPSDRYIRRRLADGDVVRAKPSAVVASPSALAEAHALDGRATEAPPKQGSDPKRRDR